jgi:Ca-activated chloride channel homolog
MTFGAPQWLWGLLLLPLLPVLFVYGERRTARRLREFVAPRLLPQLTASVDRFRRGLRFGLQVVAVAFALLALAQPRWGYIFEEAKRKGIDLLIAVDTSRSMLSNDVQPNRLQRVKLATQDLIAELQGDRVGLIAFAGRAFLQAPLTIDYDAVVEAINDVDTNTIPEGGTNISEAIELATKTYGKSAVGNRALVIFTDGEELRGEAAKAAKAAADAGIRIFTVGVGTPQGSLIPIAGEDGGTAFVKDEKGQVVKSKLDEKRLRELAAATGGLYLHLESGPATMHQLFTEGLAQLTAKEMDVRLSRQPIERYHWPLAAATVALCGSVLLGDRKRIRVRSLGRSPIQSAPAVAALLLLLSAASAFPSVTGLDLYHAGKFADAYKAFQEDLKNHPDSPERDKMEFDAGAAAYQMRDYNKAAEAFSQALLTKDKKLQENSHYNMGRTLEERADMSRSDEDALRDLENAQSHYEDVLKLNPGNAAAKANLEEVKKKIERLKHRQTTKSSATPHPPPQPSEAAKQAKERADAAVRKGAYRKALQIMDDQLQVDSTVNYYSDYIHRLQDINGIKRTDNS